MSKAAELAALIGSQTALSNRNLIINGAMQVWQRGTTIDSISSGNYLCDRWRIVHTGTDGNVDIDRSTDVPSGQGFGYSQKISMDASESSLDAADILKLQQKFEGQNLQLLAKGTSGAKKNTISFFVKSSVASTYTVELVDNDNTRHLSKSYTINSANTWESKTLTFEGDTSGSLDTDTNTSMTINIYIDTGSNLTSGTFNDSAWASTDDTKRVFNTTGWLESTSPEFYITGVQWELGEQATPFEHRSFGDELARCSRYFQLAKADMIVASSSSDIRFMIRPANAPMRTNYTLGIQGGDIRVGDMISVSSNSGTAPTQSGYENGEYGQGGGQGGYSGLTQYRVYRHEPNSTNPGIFTLDAEL